MAQNLCLVPVEVFSKCINIDNLLISVYAGKIPVALTYYKHIVD